MKVYLFSFIFKLPSPDYHNDGFPRRRHGFTFPSYDDPAAP